MPSHASVCLWRDEFNREIDSVISHSRNRIDAIEHKWNTEAFEPDSLKRFRESYKAGRNLVVAANITKPYVRRANSLEVEFVPIENLRKTLR